ncbi:MAG TPA: hypothetical protein VLK36_00940 [Gaiellaceae bacterium]|nr:hypothetical protein [Gaiellaceae bacterium]
MIALALGLVALGGDPSVHPWPIGPGPRYHPPAQQLNGRAVGGLRCEGSREVFPAHVELFVNRRVVIIPAGIGRTGRCDYPLRTRAPIGVVEVARGTRATIGDLFRLWGQLLTRHRLASFHSPRPLRAYVAGKLVRGDVARVPLTPKAQIVIELGAYVPPHRSFLFPRIP